MQPKSPMPIPPGAVAYYRNLQDIVESLGAVGQNWKVEAIPVSAQRAGWLSGVGNSEGHVYETAFGYN